MLRPMLVLLLVAVVISLTETQFSGKKVVRSLIYRKKKHECNFFWGKNCTFSNLFKYKYSRYICQVSSIPLLRSSLQMTGGSFQPLTIDKLELATTIISGDMLSYLILLILLILISQSFLEKYNYYNIKDK